jgi:hypothetical protein
MIARSVSDPIRYQMDLNARGAFLQFHHHRMGLFRPGYLRPGSGPGMRPSRMGYETAHNSSVQFLQAAHFNCVGQTTFARPNLVKAISKIIALKLCAKL